MWCMLMMEYWEWVAPTAFSRFIATFAVGFCHLRYLHFGRNEWLKLWKS